MSRFSSEFARLYGVPDPAAPTHGRLVSAQGGVKAMVLELAGPADWSALSIVWHAMQKEWELPAAAIAVSGTDGLQLWFSVAEPVPAADAAEFLACLQRKHLSALPAKRIGLFPAPASVATADIIHAKAVPAIQESTGNWSAFVSPDLASVFGEEPWLDIPPNLDQQADILSRLKPMKVPQFRDALGLLRNTVHPAEQPSALASEASDASPTKSVTYDTGTVGPRAFLTKVMNDPAVALKDRIEAAKALLPFEN
jgi:hypothetical protein